MLNTRCISILVSLLLAFPATFWSNVAFAATSGDADLKLGQKLASTVGFADDLRKTINRSA